MVVHVDEAGCDHEPPPVDRARGRRRIPSADAGDPVTLDTDPPRDTIGQTAEARRRKLKALVYVCGLMPPSGTASREMTAGEPDMLFRRSRELSPDGLTYTFARSQLPAMFYQDVSAEDRYRAMERLRPQPISISTTPVTLTEERYGSVPRWYIECTQDNAIRIARQRAMVKALPCKVLTIECGHTPFYSAPEELADHLETIARS